MENKDELRWNRDTGIGYYPVTDNPYDVAYFEKYIKYENAEIGRNLNQARLKLVEKYKWNKLLDIGVGSGVFIRDLENAYGYDINPAAIKYLKSIGKYIDPEPVDMMTFWDSLEHIHEPQNLLNNATKYVIVSTPIYKDLEHIYKSKHFRPNEHCWYFTIQGMVTFMECYGFKCIEYNRIESDIGREDIGTFVFEKI